VGTCHWFGRSTGEAHTAVAGPGKLARFTAEVLSGAVVRSNTDAAVWVGSAVLATAVVVAVVAVALGRPAASRHGSG
jgi:hypothetical protein